MGPEEPALSYALYVSNLKTILEHKLRWIKSKYLWRIIKNLIFSASYVQLHIFLHNLLSNLSASCQLNLNEPVLLEGALQAIYS
jgi:hypothetical protein